MKKTIAIFICCLVVIVMAGCTTEEKKTPQQWCEAEVVYWFEYDNYYAEVIGLTTIELDISYSNTDKGYFFKAFIIKVYYEGISIISYKFCIATIYYTGSNSISKRDIVDLDVAEIIDSSNIMWHG